MGPQHFHWEFLYSEAVKIVNFYEFKVKITFLKTDNVLHLTWTNGNKDVKIKSAKANFRSFYFSTP